MQNQGFDRDSTRGFFENNLQLIIRNWRLQGFQPAAEEVDYVVDKLTESCFSGCQGGDKEQFWTARNGRELQQHLWDFLQGNISPVQSQRLGDQTLVFSGIVAIGFNRLLEASSSAPLAEIGYFGKKNKVYDDRWYWQTGVKFYDRALRSGVLPPSQSRVISRVAQNFMCWAAVISRIPEEEWLAKTFGLSRQ